MGRTSPEGGLGLLVHLPDVPVLDGEHGEAVVVGVEQGLGDLRDLVVVGLGNHLYFSLRLRRVCEASCASLDGSYGRNVSWSGLAGACASRGCGVIFECWGAQARLFFLSFAKFENFGSPNSNFTIYFSADRKCGNGRVRRVKLGIDHVDQTQVP